MASEAFTYFSGGRRGGKSFLSRLFGMSGRKAPSPSSFPPPLEQMIDDTSTIMAQAMNDRMSAAQERMADAQIRMQNQMQSALGQALGGGLGGFMEQQRRMERAQALQNILNMNPFEVDRELMTELALFGTAARVIGMDPAREEKESGVFKDLPKAPLPKHLLQGAVKLEKKEIEERVKWQVQRVRGK